MEYADERLSGIFIHILKKNTIECIFFVLSFILCMISVMQINNIHQINTKPKITIQKNSTKQADIYVDIAGGVEKPGVYTLKQGSRIHQLLINAGGLSQKADRDYVSKYLNLSKKVEDQEKIYIPLIGLETSQTILSSMSNMALKININTCDKQELLDLPGIGEVRADKIIFNRPYTSINELKEKKIITNSIFEKIKESISCY